MAAKGAKAPAPEPKPVDPFERQMQANAREAEGRADLMHEKARSAKLANDERGSGAVSETAAKVGVHNAQAAAHQARAKVFDAQASATTAKSKNDREAHLTHRDAAKRAATNADAKSVADVAHTNARATHVAAQTAKTQAETAAVRYRTSSGARSEPFQRESEARARTVWGQQDEDRARRNAHFDRRANRENVHDTIGAVRGVLGAFGGGNGELRSGLRGQIRG